MGRSQSYTLTEVLQDDKRIFSDSSIYRSSRGWYSKIVYDKKELHQFDIGKLAKVNDALEKEISWWGQPQTLSMGKIVEEIERFNQILRGKLAYFRRQLRRNRRLKQSTPVAMHPFLEICDNYEIILHKAFASLYKPKEQDVFAVLENLVIEVGKETSAKEKRYENKNKTNKVDLHTDEQVVAAAIYSSVVEHIPCAIVTPDSDHQRLLAEVQKYIHQREDLGKISKALLENPVRVYFVRDEDDVQCNVDTSQPDYVYSSQLATEVS